MKNPEPEPSWSDPEKFLSMNCAIWEEQLMCGLLV